MTAKRKTKGKARVPAKPETALPPPDLAKAFRETYLPPSLGVVTVTLDPDVAPSFRDARAVNEALRALLRIVKQVRPG